MMSSSANPRKFSEKIAIQQRKLNEEQNAFQQIMHEVHTITRFPTPVAAQALGAPNASWNQRVAGSLPNVFQIAYHSQAQAPEFQALNNSLLYTDQWPGGSAYPQAAQLLVQTGQQPGHPMLQNQQLYTSQQQQQQHREINQPGFQGGPHVVQHAVHRGRSPGGHPHYHPYRTPSPHHSPLGSAHSVSGSPNLRARSPDRPQLTPPCQPTTSFLVPPQDSGWRRTHSDPGIHASVTHPNVVDASSSSQQTYVPAGVYQHSSPNNSPVGDSVLQATYLDPKVNYYGGGVRTKPCDVMHNMQTLNVNSGDLSAGSSQASISSNTGSLPDLSQLPPSSSGQTGVTASNAHQQPHHHQQQPLHYSQSLGYSTNQPGQQGMSGMMDGGCGGGGGDLNSPSSVGGPPVMSHQQRHSIQLPVQHAQGHFVGIGGQLYGPFAGSQSGSPSYSQNSPAGCQPDSPHSGPNSPSTTANSESPGTASQQGQSSPGSPYYSLPAQLQNINIDASDFMINQTQQQSSQQQVFYTAGNGSNQQQQHQFRMPISLVGQNQYQQQQQQMNCVGQFQTPAIVPPPPYQQPNLSGSQPQQQQSSLPSITAKCQTSCDVFCQQIQPQQQPLPSPSSGKIPNIILTGPCETTNAVSSRGYIDPAVALLSSDLRLTLDPSDLESLQVLSNEHDLIDAASEDALRRDRV